MVVRDNAGAADDRPQFQRELESFVAICQVLAGALASRQITAREMAECVGGIVPRPRSPADFLLLRSILVEFTTHALNATAPGRVDMLVPFATLPPHSGDLAGMFERCLSDPARDVASQPSIQDVRARRALSMISERYSEPGFAAASVAMTIGVSEHYLVKLLRAHSGSGFRVLVRRARIAAARALLERSLESIKEIAVRSGYTSTSQFDRDFRRECRTTPGRYRRQFWNRQGCAPRALRA